MKIEYYIETVPYEKDIPLKYGASHFDTVTSPDTGIFYGCGSVFNYAKCFRIMISNVDTVGGIFKVVCNMRTINEDFFQNIDIYIKPGDTGEILCVGDVDLGVDVELTNFKVTPPTKKETRYKEVQREKQVTAYRPITKYKIETVCN